ncbi:hypothetical protein [Microbacterium sp. 179-I 3D3 NHS]|uniref:hypothetical protein n=1 Tax=unclassified Microbacterium TaxID=2609290 RepID=UPI0039A344F1
MAAESDWTIVPRGGLGRLVFGMTPAQVDALAGTYGAITGRGSDAVPDDILRETLEMFGGAMSDEEKQALTEAYAEFGQSADSVTETRGEPGLVLRYKADRLVEIMPAVGQGPLLLDGVDLLAMTGREAMASLERLNGGPGRFAGTEAAFDDLAISADGFSVVDASSGVRALDATDPRFRARTVALLSEPYLPDDGTDAFVVCSFVA